MDAFYLKQHVNTIRLEAAAGLVTIIVKHV